MGSEMCIRDRAEQEAALKARMEERKFGLQSQEAQLQAAAKYSEEERRDFDSEVRADIAYKELELAEQSEDENRTTVISPNA